MTLTATGSAGFGQFRLDETTGEMRFDPQGAGGGWAEGATDTTVRGLVRDAAGRLAIADLATVEVTRSSTPTYVTDDMTADARWLQENVRRDELNNFQEASLKIPFENRLLGQEGVVAVGGGGFRGFIITVWQEAVHASFGTGSDVHGPNNVYLTGPCPTGDFVLEFSLSGFTHKSAMYVDGDMVDYGEFPNVDYMNGGTTGSLGGMTGSSNANPAGFQVPFDAYEGTLSYMDIFRDKITADIA